MEFIYLATTAKHAPYFCFTTAIVKNRCMKSKQKYEIIIVKN